MLYKIGICHKRETLLLIKLKKKKDMQGRTGKDSGGKAVIDAEGDRVSILSF